MSNNLEPMISNSILAQSEIFGQNYEELADEKDVPAFSSVYHKNINNIYNSIIYENTDLTDFQTNSLKNIFDSLNEISKEIDPYRLEFDFYFNNDDELLLFRESENGLTNLIINPEEDIAFSFIGKSGEKTLNFFTENDDFEKLAFNFLAL